MESLGLALAMITSGDPYLWDIIALSMNVSLTALLIATLIGLPLGAVLASQRFPGRQAVIGLINTMMGLPPVVVGLFVYMTISNSGPLGVLQLLYTPTAMIIAQTILIMPIIAALSRQTLELLAREYDQQFTLLGLGALARIRALIIDGRFELATVVLAGFGRATAEVGAVIIVGGNIDHYTRVLTTAITLETSRGNLAAAMALGIVLLSLSLLINLLVVMVRRWGESRYGYID
ncbi:MAG: ABC transporter permease [Candidatus Puniceispirillales bacterium]